MTFTYSLAVPQRSKGSKVCEFVEAWLAQPAVRGLVELDKGAWLEGGTLLERLERLHDFSQRWDFRSGSERIAIDAGASALAADQINGYASKLGLTGATPPTASHYDHVIVLGGTVLANVNRLRRVGELRDAGSTFENIALLTALRPITQQREAEMLTAAGYAEHLGNVATEFDSVLVAAANFLGGTVTTEHRDDHSATARVGTALVLAAPPGEPGRRANSADNFRSYLSRVADGDSVLIVTSSIYLPYQTFMAIQNLGLARAIHIEATGFPPDWMGGSLTGPTNVLQEMRSAFYGALQLVRASGT